MRDQDITTTAKKLFPESYTDNWWQRQQDWVSGVKWAIENSEIPDLEEKISELKDEVCDIGWDNESLIIKLARAEEKVDKLETEISEYKQTIRELNREIKE